MEIEIYENRKIVLWERLFRFKKNWSRNAFIAIGFVFFILVPNHVEAQSVDLTGYWQSDAGGCYQIRQRGNEVFWAGEPSGSRVSQNIFHGAISGTTLTGLWYDLPSNPASAFGSSICLRIENGSRLVKVSESESYRGNVWTRSNGPCNGNVSVNSNPLKWSTVHEHRGCSSPSSVCQRYDKDPIIFSSLAQGYIEASYIDIVLKGTLSGTKFNFQFYRGSSVVGNGSFTFSPDFRSFSGTFEDFNGHRGIWTGNAN
jgi:hypothetical protein